MDRPPVTVVFGARNVGRAVAARRRAGGGRVLAVARTARTLEALAGAHPGVATMHGDATEHAVVQEALERAQRELGGLDLVVNAITAPPARRIAQAAGTKPSSHAWSRSGGASMIGPPPNA